MSVEHSSNHVSSPRDGEQRAANGGASNGSAPTGSAPTRANAAHANAANGFKRAAATGVTHGAQRSGLDPSALPVDPQTGAPIPPRAQPGYYPGYDTLSQQAFWDEATRNVVLDRVNNIPPIRFFTPEELPLIEAIVARILPQDDRDAAHKIPIVPFLDQKLTDGDIDGYRYEAMPSEGEAYRLGMQGIEAIARHLYNGSFAELGTREQDVVLQTLHDGRLPAGEDIWKRLPIQHFWVQLVSDVVTIYYAHPYAWNEIGFGGPAYPRGYMRLERGEPEPWEKRERRYEWEAPPASVSDRYEPIGLESAEETQFHGKPAEAGTH